MLPMPYPETCAGDDDNTVNSVSHGTVTSCASGRTDGGCGGTATWSSSTPKNWFITHCCATCGMRTDEEGPELETDSTGAGPAIAIICSAVVVTLLIAGYCWKKHHRPNTVVEPVVGVARAVPVTIPLGVVRGKVVG
jgi:hypothetical protein